MEALVSDTEKLLNELTFLRKENMSVFSSLEKEINDLEGNIDLLSKVSSLFKHLLDKLLEDKKKEIETLVTYGLKTVFTDQDLKFNIYLEQKYGGISTTFKTEMVGLAEGDVLESFGGGIVNIESFLLRIITLFQTGLAPYLFLDETFANLSDEYCENCSALLKSICSKLGVTVFLVTHNELMLSSADKIYRAEMLNSKFVLKEAK